MNGSDMHAASVGVFSAMLGNVPGWLDKAAAHAGAGKFDMGVLFASRLAPDMFPLTTQVHFATAFAKNAATRLSGRAPPDFGELSPTLEAVRARIADTQAILTSVKPADLDGASTRELTIQTGPDQRMTLSGADYLHRFAMPQFYFHVTTAYAILRENGVPLGKRDFLGGG